MSLRRLSLFLSLIFLSVTILGCRYFIPSPPPPSPTETPVPSEEKYPEIQEYLRLSEARDQLPDLEAVKELEAIIAARSHSPAACEAHVALARHYAQLGDPAAEDEYRAALELEANLGLRLELARWLEEQGRREAAYVEYKGLLGQYPRAFEDMRRLGDDPLQVARDLNSASYWSDALEELNGVEDPSAGPIRARALSGLGRYEEAARLYHEWLEEHPEDTEARMGLARSLQRQGEREEALTLYEKVDTADSLLAQAGLWASEEPTRAITLYLQCPYPVAKWRATKLLEAQGRLTETLPLYTELAKGQTYWADDAAYRVYVLADRLGELEERSRARQLLGDAQPNFLALKLGEEWKPSMALPFRPAGAEVLSKAVALESLGLEKLAHRELVMAARFDSRPEARTAYVQALFDRGYLVDAQRVAEGMLNEMSKAPLSLWRLAYPKPYAAEVRAAAEEFDLDPLLLWAIMHTESRYKPEALSWARAQGLMQLIPSTADWAAESAGIPFTPLRAYDVEVNIRLGAWYLRWLLDYFDDDMELAVTAYNGGPGNVKAWNEQVSNRDDFLRWIGSGESREYVNQVLTVYHVYQELEELER